MEYRFYWYAEGSKGFHNSKIVSLKDSLQKANKKLKIQAVPKTKDYKTNDSYYPLSIFLYLSTHSLRILYLNCLSTLK